MPKVCIPSVQVTNITDREEGPQLQNPNGLPDPSEGSEAWRYTTIERLELAIKEKGSPNNIVESHTKWVKMTVEELVETLIIAINPSERSRLKVEMEKLVKVVTPFAIDLARQRCRMEFFYPKQNVALKDSELDVVNNRNRRETKRVGMKVALVIAPGLKKIGDVRGGFQNKDKDTALICPAEVFLDPN